MQHCVLESSSLSDPHDINRGTALRQMRPASGDWLMIHCLTALMLLSEIPSAHALSGTRWAKVNPSRSSSASSECDDCKSHVICRFEPSLHIWQRARCSTCTQEAKDLEIGCEEAKHQAQTDNSVERWPPSPNSRCFDRSQPDMNPPLELPGCRYRA